MDVDLAIVFEGGNYKIAIEDWKHIAYEDHRKLAGSHHLKDGDLFFFLFIFWFIIWIFDQILLLHFILRVVFPLSDQKETDQQENCPAYSQGL
jgi:hypothetical protein